MNATQAVKNRIGKEFSQENWRWQGWTFSKTNYMNIDNQGVYVKFLFDLKTIKVTVSEHVSGKVTAEREFTAADSIDGMFTWTAEKAIETADGINKRVAPFAGCYNAYNTALRN
ncbi:MAG: hypothetical protein LUD19_01220 [Clostridia bacterium]|nr:hypothetical protein [Clostridia bacterium]